MKEFFEWRSDIWRRMFGIGSFWSIFIPLVIICFLILNIYTTSKFQYDEYDLADSYMDGYNKATDEHTNDYENGYWDGFEDAVDIAYDEGYSAATSDMK